MNVTLLHDKDEIESFLRHNTPLHLYELGDLDEFFWPYTSWYALKEGGQVTALVLLSSRDLHALNSLYLISYPGNWFDPRMLETGHYYGIWRDGMLVSVAGVHVYSPRYKVGVLGNVTTHPGFRGQGLGKAVCAKLCVELLKTVDDVGLNVRADNASAITAYRHLGFEVIGEYEEGLLVSR